MTQKRASLLTSADDRRSVSEGVPGTSAILISCEHASPSVPKRFADELRVGPKVLDSHRGFDRGAHPFARRLARRWKCPLVAGEVTRLLIDLNRSRTHRGLFSEFSRQLSPASKHHLLERYYLPYRQRVLQTLADLAPERIVHLSIHSFVPVLNGKVRQVDLGLLFDPSRPREQRLAEELRAEVKRLRPELRVRFNRPYRGVADGLTSGLRGWLPEAAYAGLEIELSQGLLTLWEQPSFANALARRWLAALQAT